MQLDNDKLKQTIFIVALFALGGFLFWLLEGFLTAFLGAVVFYIILWYTPFLPHRKEKKQVEFNPYHYPSDGGLLCGTGDYPYSCFH